MENIFKGLISAIITPFKGNKIDFVALEKIIDHQISGKVDGIVVAGSTGEGNSLSSSELTELIGKATIYANSKIKVIAGCCSSSTQQAIQLAEIAEKSGVDGIMVTVPPYVKPTQEGIFGHIKAVHDAINLPLMIYNTHSRTGADIADTTILNLSKLCRVIALKDSSIDLERPLRLRNILGDNFNLLSGDDPLALAFNAQGGNGCVSVAGNIAPHLCKQIQDEWVNGSIKKALEIQLSLLPLYEALFNESNPIPVKYAASVLGLCENELRMPLLRANSKTMEKIDLALQKLNLK